MDRTETKAPGKHFTCKVLFNKLINNFIFIIFKCH